MLLPGHHLKLARVMEVDFVMSNMASVETSSFFSRNLRCRQELEST
jgi:hypothetical protein